MAFNRQKLDTFKQQLLARRDILAKEIQQGTADLIEEDPFFADSVDQAAADTDRGIAVQMKNRERGILTEIDFALRRIEAGTFGECESCSEEIGEQRMKATTLCIDCQAELESERGRFPRWA